MVIKICYIYILAVNPKRNAGIDRYPNTGVAPRVGLPQPRPNFGCPVLILVALLII